MYRRLPQLDAVRGIAILLVIFHNTCAKYPGLGLQRVFADGWMGVDLFFVLSGYLITRQLLEARESAGYFRNFYLRRSLRIWPLYYSVLAFVFVVLPLLQVPGATAFFEHRSSPWWSYPFFLQDLLVAVPQLAAGPLGVMWSLAVEEQFYLVWPWVVRYCSRERLYRVTLAIICLSPAVRWVLSHEWHANIYSNPLCRLDGLMAGALFALILQTRFLTPPRFTRHAAVVLAMALILAVFTEGQGGRWLVHSFVILASVSLVYLALFSTGRLFRFVMTNRFLVYTGTISYALYLIHKIPFDAAQALRPFGHSSLVLPIGMAGAYALAALSWKLIEEPCLKLRRTSEPLSGRKLFLSKEPDRGIADRSTVPFPIQLAR